MSFDLRPRKRAGAIGNPFAEREEMPFARKGICFLQHDMDVANGSGATVRADFNNAIEALVTLSSGATEPGTTYAYQLWADTTSGLLKQRNAANTAWEVRGTLAETLSISRSSNTILAAGDYMKYFVATATFTQTLTAAATLGDGWACHYRVDSGVTITFDPNSAETIDGATTKAFVGPSAGIIFCDGSGFRSYGFTENATQAEADAGTADKVLTADLNRIVLAAMQATSGTAKDFTGIPSGTRKIIIQFNGVSLDGGDVILVQLGDSGGIEATGYTSTAVYLEDGGGGPANSNTVNATNGFVVGTNSASDAVIGQMILTLMDEATNLWVSTHNVLKNTAETACGAGSKALSAELTQLRIAASTGNFDAGSVNITYER